MHYHVVNTKPIRNYVKMANRNTGAQGPEWVTISKELNYGLSYYHRYFAHCSTYNLVLWPISSTKWIFNLFLAITYRDACREWNLVGIDSEHLNRYLNVCWITRLFSSIFSNYISSNDICIQKISSSNISIERIPYNDIHTLKISKGYLNSKDLLQ